MCIKFQMSDMARSTNMQSMQYLQQTWTKEGFFFLSNNRTLGGSHYILCSIFISSLSCQLFSILGRKKMNLSRQLLTHKKRQLNLLYCKMEINNLLPPTVGVMLKINFAWLLNKIHQIHH